MIRFAQKKKKIYFGIILLLLITLFGGCTSFTSAEAFDAVFNFREVAGYEGADGKSIKEGLLYRSGELGSASEDDIRYLDTLDIAYVFDLRSEEDFIYYPDESIQNARIKNIPLSGSSPSEEHIKKRMATMRSAALLGIAVTKMARNANPCSYGYTRDLFTSARARKGYAKILRLMLKTKGRKAVLFHCIHGKDRTGSCAAVIMLALGCSDEDVISEYALSNKAKKKVLGPEYSKAVSVSRFRRALNYAKTTWGSWDLYLKKGIGLTKKEIRKLRKYYLE